jgi:hypothetical protein
MPRTPAAEIDAVRRAAAAIRAACPACRAQRPGQLACAACAAAVVRLMVARGMIDPAGVAPDGRPQGRKPA